MSTNGVSEITEADQEFINEKMGPIGGLFGEETAFQAIVDASVSELDPTTLEPCILVVGKYKLIVVKKDKNRKVKLSIHLYDLQEINEPPVGGHVPSQECVEIRYKNQNTNQIQSLYIKSIDRKVETIMVKSIAFTTFTISRGFPTYALLKINLPKSRYPPLQFNFDFGSDGKGIAEQYIAHSHYFNEKATLDYLRHLETLFQTYYPELDLSNLPGIDATCSLGFNLFTSIICLRHNPFIKSLKICNVPHINVVASVGHMMQTNTAISELCISNLLTEQSFAPIGAALQVNDKMALQKLDLSNNILSYESITSLSEGFAHFNHSLVELNLSKCNIPPRGVASIFQAFERNYAMSLTLEVLDLSENRFQDAGSNALSSWLSKARGANKLRELILSQTQLNFTVLAPPLRVLEVEKLDLSRNKINLASARLLAVEAFECFGAIKFLNLSQCGLIADSVQVILSAFTKNKKITKSSLTIDLSQNSFAGKTGGRLVQLLPQASHFLCGLDLSLNQFNTRQLVDILASLASVNITALNIGYNPINANDEVFMAGVLDFVSKHPQLTKLGIATTRGYGKTLHTLIQQLYNNKSITALDITGNEMNDHGACLLADCLRHNRTLSKLFISGNQFTAVGWQSMASPLLFYRNTTLTTMELPSSHVPILNSDSNLLPLTPDRRDKLEKVFEQIRFHLALNRNKVNASSRFAYLPPSDPPLYVKAPAVIPEHLSDISAETQAKLEKMNLNGSTRVNGNGKSSSPNITSLFTKPINQILAMADMKEIGDTTYQSKKSSTPSSWNDDEWKNKQQDDERDDD